MGALFREKHELATNGTTLVIAEIISVSVTKECLSSDGFADLEKAGSLTCSGLDSYHHTVQLSSLSYAKPDSWPHPFGQPEIS